MSLSLDRIKNIRPLFDRVLIERSPESENRTAGGIFIPDQAKEKAQIGKIIAIGTGKVLSSGTVQKMTVAVGDHVYFSKYAGTEISEEFVIVREDEIIGII